MGKSLMAAVVGAGVCLSQADFDLASLYTQTVKTGQPWASIYTRIDSVELDVRIDHGVATTTATIAYTPGDGLTQGNRCVPVQCVKEPCPDTACVWTVDTAPAGLDSLETSAGFDLTRNIAAAGMDLWVDGVAVPAQSQPRALASAQYEDIVKRRRDPALLETWGWGGYNLRIFPNRSGQTRKFRIRFVQGLETDSAGFAARLPVMRRASTHLVPGGDPRNPAHDTIGLIRLKAAAPDGKRYSLRWPGLGEATLGAQPIELIARNAESLGQGLVSEPGAACAGDCLIPWTASRAGGSWFGVKAVLRTGSLELEAQPRERCVIVDVDGADTAAPERARKLALLSLKAYGQEPYAANLAFADGKGGLEFAWPEAAAMDADRLAQAYSALRSWRPAGKADAKAALEAYARSRRGRTGKSIAILIDNEPYPSYPYPANYDPLAMPQVEREARAFYEAQNARIAALADTLKAAQAVLFGFWNDWYLGQAASSTGGYSLGSVNGWIYYPDYYLRNAMDVASVAPSAKPGEWILPPLFGPGRPDAYSASDLSVEADGLGISDLAVLQDQYYWYGPVFLAGGSAVAKRADVMPGYRYSAPESLAVRISGKFQGAGAASLTLSGTWGGLRFSRKYSVALSAIGAGPDGASIWAYQESEALSNAESGSLAAVQALGRDYGIVNRQMSLLALEPGTPLWTELPAKQGSSPAAGAPVVSSDAKMSGGGMNLDAPTLEEILAARVDGLSGPAPAAGPAALRARASIGGLDLSWDFPASSAGASAARFRILDVTGRAVADLAAARAGDRFTARWPGAKRGVYLVRAECGGTIASRRIVLPP